MSIELFGSSYKFIQFPAGESHVRVTRESGEVRIKWTYEDDSELFILLLLCDALNRLQINIAFIQIPYVPHARQDRITVPGESLSIKVFADVLNTLGETILINDAHSPVTTALINNCVEITQYEGLQHVLEDKIAFYLVCPDAGAHKKIIEFATHRGCLGIVECSKVRDTVTGNIVETKVDLDYTPDMEMIIIDDICDGGRTFIEIAKVLHANHAGKVTLAVTHGLFTKGIEALDIIDEIWTREGKAK